MAHVAVDPTRNYAHFEGRSMVLNHSGKVIIEGLAPYFPEILDAGFTKNMEEHLDDIAKKTEG
jgi:DNA topoisomerase IA